MGLPPFSISGYTVMGLLTDRQIQSAAHRPTEYFLSDGDGLYLRVRPTRKVWVYRYKQDGREVKLGLGRYPVVSLAVARQKARSLAEKRAGGIDPKQDRRAVQERDRVQRLNTFELVARAWQVQAKKDRAWSDDYAYKVVRALELHVFPWLGRYPMPSVVQTEIVRCLHRIRDRGHLETAQRIRGYVREVYQYAADTGVLESVQNFMTSSTGGLPAPRERSYAAITDPKRLGQLMRDIRGYKGNIITRAALQLAPIVFQRPGQLRFAHWEDMALDAGIWTCPPEKMKIREWKKQDSRTPPHLVPLPRQAVEILRDIYPLTGPTGPVFRNMARRSEGSRYMSENTVNSALRTLGYDTEEDITGHGFRATARTLIREYLGWDPDVIERHLAHGSDEELGDSYDRATLLEQRRHMVQAWADLLDALAEGKVAVPVRKFGKIQADFVKP
jgi:integrase